MFVSLFDAILAGLSIFILVIVAVLITNLIIQKNRAKKYYKEGYISAVDRGFKVKKTENGYEIIADEKHSVLF